jgi:hypothetical protein
MFRRDENHFRFDHKTLFNFWKTIYGFKNCKSFFEIKLFVLAHTFYIRLLKSSNSRLSESRRHRNPAISSHRNPDADGPDSGRIWWIWPKWPGSGRIWPKWPGSGWIWRSPDGIWSNKLAGIRQRRPNVSEFRQQLYFHLS